MIFKLTHYPQLAALGLILVAAILFTYTRIAAPDQGAVNGVYFNQCCGDIALRDGSLSYKGASYKYNLTKMKFGLTAYVQGILPENDIEPSLDKTAFIFFSEKGKSNFKTTIRGRDYLFLKKK